MTERFSNGKGSILDTTASKLSKLIGSGDSVNAGSGDVDFDSLKKVFINGEITKSQYDDLLEKLMKRKEWAEYELSKISKNLKVKVEELKIDPLTKFFGRPLLLPKLNELIKELNSSELHHRKSDINAIMVIVLDMNGLKFFNDNYNHMIGDQALLTLAERIKKTTRRNDILFRAGGDEFIVFLPIENKDANFEEIFGKFKDGINNNLNITIENDGKNFPITVSAGYSVLEKGKFRKATELLKEADNNDREDKKKIKSGELK